LEETVGNRSSFLRTYMSPFSVPLLGGGTRSLPCLNAILLSQNKTLDDSRLRRVPFRTNIGLNRSRFGHAEGEDMKTEWTFEGPVLVSVSSGSLLPPTPLPPKHREVNEDTPCQGEGRVRLVDASPYTVRYVPTTPSVRKGTGWDHKEETGKGVGVGILHEDGSYEFTFLLHPSKSTFESERRRRRRLQTERCPLLLSSLTSNVCLGRSTETCLVLTEKFVGNECCLL